MRFQERITGRGRLIVFILSLILIPASATVAMETVCGDANGDLAVNIGDAVFLINYVFKVGVVPDPLSVGDVNCDGAVNVGDAVYIIHYIFRNGPAPCCILPAIQAEFGQCKEFREGNVLGVAQDCFEYEYDGQGVLSVTRINAGFNCCLDSISAVVTLADGAITIDEVEHPENGGCYCLCLYDLSYDINGIEPGQYMVTVIEPYVEEGMEPLEFILTLSSEPSSGSFCVTRTHYPWDLVGEGIGELIGYSGCKPVEGQGAYDGRSNNQDCLVFTYDEVSTLTLDHINAAFNCCPDTIAADITIADNLITITEWESTDLTGGCDCLCLFDLNYEIIGLTPGTYTIRVIEPYASGQGDPLEFTVNLILTPSGEFCVERTEYPWIE